jgi:DnaK suppressor protein
MPATELDHQQIEALRCLLVSSQQVLEEQMLSTGSSTKPVTLDQQSVGRVSRIDAIQQQQMAIANQQQAEQLLTSIDMALLRINSGEYGTCLQCDEPIAFARLQAQPYATLCIDCQSASENP